MFVLVTILEAVSLRWMCQPCWFLRPLSLAHKWLLSHCFFSHGLPSECICLLISSTYQNTSYRTSLVVQWLRFHTSNAGGMGLIPGWGMKIPLASRHSQKKKKLNTSHIQLGLSKWPYFNLITYLKTPYPDTVAFYGTRSYWTCEF